MSFLRSFLCCLLLAECALAANSTDPNILLITLDTTRADRMGFLGCKRGLTPNLDVLAGQGIVFTRAYSQVPLTVPSHATILTGTYPQYHRVTDFGLPLSKELPYLPQILQARGYKTAAFVASVVLDPKSEWAPGIDRGFDTYDAGDVADLAKPGERPAGVVIANARAWLKNHGRGPFFLWVHLYDPHLPYAPPEPFLSRFRADPYDGEIAYADSELGKLFEDLRASGLYDHTLIAMMADHGEAFGEHGERTHGVFLYDETIHVPLLFKLPGQRFPGERLDMRAGLVDVAPTVLNVAGLPIPKTMQGESLLTLMQSQAGQGAGAGAPDRQIYSETDYPHNLGWSALRSLRTGKYLFVEAPRKELYDQSADPGAEHNLAPTASAVTQTLSDKLALFRTQTESKNVVAAAEIDPQLVQRLAALGYIAGSSTNRKPGSEMTGPDPKDKIEIANSLQEAFRASENGRPEEAVRILEQLLAKDPSVLDIPPVFRTLALAWMKQGNYDKALPLLRKAVELNPGASVDHFRLGQGLFEAGDLEAAKAETETAIAKASLVNLKYAASLHYFLAAILRKMGKATDSIRELEVAVQLNPGDYESNLTLGRLLSMDGKPGNGLPYLQKAADLKPQLPEPHAFLADAYTELGREAEASVERMEAGRLQAREVIKSQPE